MYHEPFWYLLWYRSSNRIQAELRQPHGNIKKARTNVPKYYNDTWQAKQTVNEEWVFFFPLFLSPAAHHHCAQLCVAAYCSWLANALWHPRHGSWTRKSRRGSSLATRPLMCLRFHLLTDSLTHLNATQPAGRATRWRRSERSRALGLWSEGRHPLSSRSQLITVDVNSLLCQKHLFSKW